MKRWFLFAAALTVFLAVTTAAEHRGAGFDLAPLAAAGQLAGTADAAAMYAHDTDYYNRVHDPAFLRASRAIGFAFDPTPYVYPPLVASAAGLIPARFPIVSRAWAWISALALAAGLVLGLANYLPGRFSLTRASWLLLAVCAFEPVTYGFWLGQTTAAVFLLVMAAVALNRRHHWAVSGLLLALAAYIKITPILLAGVWLWRGQRRSAWACVAAVAALWALSLVVNGVALNVAYIGRVAEISGQAVLALNNHSLPAFIGRLVQPAAEDWRVQALPQGVQLTTIAMAALLTVCTFLAAPRRRSSADSWLPVAESLAFGFMLLVPNVAWTHYFVFLLPGILLLLDPQAAGHAPWRIAGAASFLLCCTYVMPRQEALPVVGPHLLVTGPTLAVLLVCGTLLLRTRRESGTATS